MNASLIRFLKKYSTNENKINSLIVSSFISHNNILIKKNRFIKKYIIVESSKHNKHLSQFNSLLKEQEVIFNFEFLIELFEFIVSPKDKVVNGAVYTPEYIREYITLGVLRQTSKDLSEIKACDLSVGCGGFLFSFSQIIKSRTGKLYAEIFKENIYGLDITPYSIERSKILLSLLALSKNEDSSEFKFNLHIGNALDFSWKRKHSEIKSNNGFDIILGNPPYVCSRNINKESLKLLANWSVCKTGHPDLYIPFFQIGVEELSPNGILGFITVNTFIKSVNGRALRQYFSEKKISLIVVDFGGEQIFKNRNTYTCLCFLTNNIGNIKYKLVQSMRLKNLNDEECQKYNYEQLNNNDGWNLVNSRPIADMIEKVESIGSKFKDLYITRNGIATLRNEVYIFTPTKSTKDYFYLTTGKLEFRIEKEICRNIINSNTIKTDHDLKINGEKIIFPFINKNGRNELIDESLFKEKYPFAYQYLKNNETILNKRDKGKAKKKYAAWYDYGRRQSLDINSYKLFFPHICEKPTFLLCRDKDLLFYNGIAVISNDFKELEILKKILESDLFFNYIRNTTKNYASGYISLSKNYIKNFGIYNFSPAEKQKILQMTDNQEIDEFLKGRYKLNANMNLSNSYHSSAILESST